jgi:hypothetical protein
MNESVMGAVAQADSFSRPSRSIGALVRIARETVIGRPWRVFVVPVIVVACENAIDGMQSATRAYRT